MDRLTCNFKECFKEIESLAWVTFCSHIFCNEHGKRISSDWRNVGCLACNSKLEANHQIIQTKLYHSKAMKSLLLCGHDPKAIMEIANSALSFWSYQKNFENKILKKQVEHYRNKLKSNQMCLEESIKSKDVKLECMEMNVEKLTKEKYDLKMELAVLKEKMLGMDKSRKSRKRNSQDLFEDLF